MFKQHELCVAQSESDTPVILLIRIANEDIIAFRWYLSVFLVITFISSTSLTIVIISFAELVFEGAHQRKTAMSSVIEKKRWMQSWVFFKITKWKQSIRTGVEFWSGLFLRDRISPSRLQSVVGPGDEMGQSGSLIGDRINYLVDRIHPDPSRQTRDVDPMLV